MRNREVRREGASGDRDMGRETGENQRDIQEGMKRYGKTGTEMRGDRDIERQVWGCGRNAGIERQGHGYGG